jgi:hypothetical protein
LFGSQRINEVTPGVLGSLLLPRSNQGRYQFSPMTFFSKCHFRITTGSDRSFQGVEGPPSRKRPRL